MIIPDRKKTVSVIISRMNPDGKPSGNLEVKPEEAIDERMGAIKSIAEEIMMAIKSGSAMDLAQALKAFMVEAQDVDQELDEA